MDAKKDKSGWTEAFEKFRVKSMAMVLTHEPEYGKYQKM